MDAELHTSEIGRLVTFLQLLETQLRMAIAVRDPQHEGVWRWGDLHAGQQVPIDAITDYRGLAETIRPYNTRVEGGDRLDAEAIVALRHFLAHARVASTGDAAFPMRLVKFGEETPEGLVPVERVDDLTEEWFSQHLVLVAGAWTTVVRATAKLAGLSE